MINILLSNICFRLFIDLKSNKSVLKRKLLCCFVTSQYYRHATIKVTTDILLEKRKSRRIKMLLHLHISVFEPFKGKLIILSNMKMQT